MTEHAEDEKPEENNRDFERKAIILRDFLALDRTKLASHRTLLAYVRTSLMLFTSGITLFKLLPDNRVLYVLGIVFIPVSFLVFFLGVGIFIYTKKTINDAYK